MSWSFIAKNKRILMFRTVMHLIKQIRTNESYFTMGIRTL
uniref:Uncharacterized protein n=1 Tax=Arundo donax TaxID=35708 RepID=A0A0A9GKQ1_ARUDO